MWGIVTGGNVSAHGDESCRFFSGFIGLLIRTHILFLRKGDRAASGENPESTDGAAPTIVPVLAVFFFLGDGGLRSFLPAAVAPDKSGDTFARLVVAWLKAVAEP